MSLPGKKLSGLASQVSSALGVQMRFAERNTDE
jgi:hypothetical protein